jgi:hypothetical protein
MRAPFDPSASEFFELNGWDFDAGVLLHRYALDGIDFEERFVFPHADRLDTGSAFERACDVLHVAASTSYYKAGAPGMVTGIPGWLPRFAEELFLHGLAEFALTNQLDPIRPGFALLDPIDFDYNPEEDDHDYSSNPGDPALVAVGGGKDSIVTIESMKRARKPFVLGSVRTHRAIEDTAALAGVEHLVIDRIIDPKLLELNDRGALNGHVPVTAINSSALAALAIGLGLSAVIMSNEASASVPITSHRGLEVNHQWSKSLECEETLSFYLPVPYFSLLRPLHEVEICRRFAKLPQYFGTVTSCNRAYTATGRAAGTRWCGDCPKCRFVFLGLAVFLPPPVMRQMFDGLDLLVEPSSHAIDAYRSLLGLGGEPPLECVGTVVESNWAITRLARDPLWSGHAVVRALVGEARVDPSWDPLAEREFDAIPEHWRKAADALS